MKTPRKTFSYRMAGHIVRCEVLRTDSDGNPTLVRTVSVVPEVIEGTVAQDHYVMEAKS